MMKVKGKIVSLLCALGLLACSIGSLGGCSKKQWEQGLDMAVAGAEAYIAVSSDDMVAKRRLMVKYVLKANAKFMDAVATLQDAVGNKEKGDILRAKASDIQSNPQNYQSEAALKEVFATSNNAAREVTRIDTTAVDATEHAKEKMDEAYVRLGMAA